MLGTACGSAHCVQLHVEDNHDGKYGAITVLDTLSVVFFGTESLSNGSSTRILAVIGVCSAAGSSFASLVSFVSTLPSGLREERGVLAPDNRNNKRQNQ